MAYAHKRLSSRRWEHTVGVVKTVDLLAESHRLSRKECRTIAWLHDATKEKPGTKFLDLVERGEIEVDRETLETPKIWHGYHAAYVGLRKFGIEKNELLDAIRYHSTGAPGLSPEGLVLYIADYCEPAREVPRAGEILERAKTDLDGAAIEVAIEKLRYLAEKGRTPHSMSLAFRQWLLNGGSRIPNGSDNRG